MALKDFEASRGDVDFLKVARGKAMTALVQGRTLDVKLSAAIIAVAAGYVYMSKVRERRFDPTSAISNAAVSCWWFPTYQAKTLFCRPLHGSKAS